MKDRKGETEGEVKESKIMERPCNTLTHKDQKREETSSTQRDTDQVINLYRNKRG